MTFPAQQHNLVAMEGIDQPPLHQVQDLHCAVTGRTDEVVVRWVK